MFLNALGLKRQGLSILIVITFSDREREAIELLYNFQFLLLLLGKPAMRGLQCPPGTPLSILIVITQVYSISWHGQVTTQDQL